MLILKNDGLIDYCFNMTFLAFFSTLIVVSLFIDGRSTEYHKVTDKLYYLKFCHSEICSISL